MTTTTSSTSTPTPTPSSTASIISTLGAGSGIDTGSLVTQLVAAQFATKNDTLSKQSDKLTAQISAVGQLQSDITAFAQSLQTLISGGSLSTQPTTSNSSLIGASTLPGAHIGDISAQVEVDRLATAQSAATATSFTSRSATVGTGNLMLTFGTATVSGGAMTAFTAGSAAPVNIAIDSAHNTVDGIASAINASKAGVTASVVTDADGTARLMIKGATGSAQAFTLSGDTPELQQLNVGVGESATTIGSAALNAQLKLDGLSVERATNTVSDLITGVQLNLNSASPGSLVTIGSATPADALTQAVNDFVTTYNQFIGEVQGDTNAATGVLYGDSAVSSLQRTLSQLTLTKLTKSTDPNVPSTLAEIGVGTNRDGTLKVDATQLANAIANNPDAVEAMFANGATASGSGLGGALSTMAANAANTTYGLAASTATYTVAQSKVADAQDKAKTDAQTMTDRLTSQFSNMDTIVASYKSTQTFLTQQIAAWNAANSNG